MNKSGYATLAIDRLGTGRSSALLSRDVDGVVITGFTHRIAARSA